MTFAEELHNNSQKHVALSGLTPSPASARELDIKAEEDRRNAWIAANPDKGLRHYYAEKNAAEVQFREGAVAERPSFPSAADLDAVAEEQKAAEATGDSNATGQ